MEQLTGLEDQSILISMIGDDSTELLWYSEAAVYPSSHRHLQGHLVINNVTTHMHTHALSDTITHSAKPSCVAQRVWSVSAGRAGRRRWRRLPDVRREQYWISLPSLTDYHGDVF